MDVVDLSFVVISMVFYFFMYNQGVLDDLCVIIIVMDGWVWLCCMDCCYDVIILEFMLFNFVGVNVLYFEEFYWLVVACLNFGGVVV